VHSLASEHLQELENLVGSARQEQEEVVVAALGSLYKGEVPYSLPYVGLTGHPFSRSRNCASFLIFLEGFLPIPTIKTVSSMYSLFLALVLFPQVQTRAQAELDLVIGRDRLPTFDDRPRLPYIEAFCKELMRWFVVVPMGTILGLP
jgi:Cytochrome P450